MVVRLPLLDYRTRRCFLADRCSYFATKLHSERNFRDKREGKFVWTREIPFSRCWRKIFLVICPLVSG